MLSLAAISRLDAGHAEPFCPHVALGDARGDTFDHFTYRFPTVFVVDHPQPPVPAVKMAENPWRVRPELLFTSEQSSFLSLYCVRERCSRNSLQKDYKTPRWRRRGRSAPACPYRPRSIRPATISAIREATGVSWRRGTEAEDRGRPRPRSTSSTGWRNTAAGRPNARHDSDYIHTRLTSNRNFSVNIWPRGSIRAAGFPMVVALGPQHELRSAQSGGIQ